jgi:hypothetical protein
MANPQISLSIAKTLEKVWALERKLGMWSDLCGEMRGNREASAIFAYSY